MLFCYPFGSGGDRFGDLGSRMSMGLGGCLNSGCYDGEIVVLLDRLVAVGSCAWLREIRERFDPTRHWFYEYGLS